MAIIVVVLHAWNPTSFRTWEIVALVMSAVLLGPGVCRYFTETELAVEDERVVVRTSRKGRVFRTQRVRFDDLSRIIILLFQPNRDSYGMRLGLFADGALAAEGYHRKLLEDRVRMSPEVAINGLQIQGEFVVPEPTSVSLLALATSQLLLRRRR